MITSEMTLADVVKAYPQTIPYLNDLHLDYCCGGHQPIRTLAGTVKESELLEQLNAIASKPVQTEDNRAEDIERFRTLSIAEMIDDVQETHHVKERQLMAETEAYLNKILVVHYPNHGELLSRLHHLYALLKADLEEHFAKEERLTFPLMKEHPLPEQAQIDAVKELEAEHSAAGDLIKEIQKLTNEFELPADACPTFAHTYQLMESLFEDIFIHIFKENSILFPEYYEKGETSTCRICGAETVNL
jgi:regulator of cell morphogenesis and NO signaling